MTALIMKRWRDADKTFSAESSSCNRGVSHVVAVALLVAIVVSLAIVISIFAVSLGSVSGEPAPNVVFVTSFDDTLESNGQYLNITHDGGDDVISENVRLKVSGAETEDGDSISIKSGELQNQIGSEWTVKETLVIDRRAFVLTSTGANVTDNIVLEDAVIRLIFRSEGNDYTSIIYQCRPAGSGCEG